MIPAPRLNASPETALQAPRPAVRFSRTCIECGEAFRTSNRTADFCGNTHRQAFNNRRMRRGADLYDLFMAGRYDRHTAKAEKVMTMLSRMAQDFRAEDLKKRAGRKSWQHPRRVLERHPHLQAVKLKTYRRKPS